MFNPKISKSMKEIKKEKVTYETVYVANDGTEFKDREECRKYDESAEGVLNAVLKKFTVKECVEEDLFNFGSCDNNVEILRPTCEDDKKAILQMYLLKNSYIMQKKEHEHYIERAEELIDRAIKENDFLLIGRGYDYDSFWFYGTRRSMQEGLDAFLSKNENA